MHPLFASCPKGQKGKENRMILDLLKYGVALVGVAMFITALMRAKDASADPKSDIMKVALPWIGFAVALMFAAFGIHLLEQLFAGIPADSTIATGANIVDGILKLFAKDINTKLGTVK
mgnify:CR=1 FL=1